MPLYAPFVADGALVRRNALWGARRSGTMGSSAHPPGELSGCVKGRTMIAASQLTILVSAVALICIVSMMLFLRGEATRKRVAELERRMGELDASEGGFSL